MDLVKFIKVVKIVIDNLEGGYYHPLMIQDGRVKDNPVFHASKYQKESGETMYGEDRLNGASLFNNDYGRKFWSLIDSADAKHKWHYNYMGGDLAPQLEQLVANIMFPAYDHLCSVYLLPKTQILVNSDERLSFHFAYATWNGAGYFQHFAEVLNESVNKGITNVDALVNIALDSRLNSSSSLIKNTAQKISILFKKMQIV